MLGRHIQTVGIPSQHPVNHRYRMKEPQEVQHRGPIRSCPSVHFVQGRWSPSS